MIPAQRLPAGAAAEARAFAAGSHNVAPARPASTVVLVRDGDAGVEVYVHQRHPGMAFAGGMVAFPGGSVDPADLEPTGAVDARIWAQRLGTTETAALGFVRAALRETEEETGLRLGAADLVPWAHWITPRFQPRRFDTWFFLARVPAEQRPQDVSGEATAVAWVAARTAIAKAETGEWIMLPPTRAIFEELSVFASVDDLPTEERIIDAITPGWIDLGDSVIALLPDDPRYPGDDPGESE